MHYTIFCENDPKPENVQILGNGIMAYAKQQKGLDPLNFFAFFLRDDAKNINGGCNGNTLYGCLHIDQLWVAESLRGLGYGRKLMEASERWGIEHQCTFATVNTMDWEALPFYQKLGYRIEFERRGFSKNSALYFLRKVLNEKE